MRATLDMNELLQLMTVSKAFSRNLKIKLDVNVDKMNMEYFDFYEVF